MRDFRFGVNYPTDKIADWIEHCRTAEQQGYDAVHAPDHLGSPAPFAMLAAAAQVTERLRLGTYVLNNGFWNPHLLAREAATVDQLSGGRLELGLGLGYVRDEFDTAGIPWEPHADRVGRLGASINTLNTLFAEGGAEPRPAQQPRPPIMIGGHNERLLRLAAEVADIVAFTGAVARKDGPSGALRLVPPDDVDERVELVRSEAGERLPDIEFGSLIQYVEITDDAERSAADLVERFNDADLDTTEKILANPFIKIGTPAELADEIVRDRDRFGFTYLVTHGPHRDKLAQVISAVRARVDST
ncbi:MAG TPA: TIGR03621 family F420-dependent LLM class oxidoreductase [Jiangellaceae bacterium]